MRTVSPQRSVCSSACNTHPMASSMHAIMPQVSARASCASRADTLIVFMPSSLAVPASRSAMTLRTSGGGVQSLRLNASGTAKCSGLDVSQYWPGGLNGGCGWGNDTVRKNGCPTSPAVTRAVACAPRKAVGESWAGRCSFVVRRAGGEVLQVARADERGAVLRIAQQPDEGDCLHRQRNAVAAYAVHRRHPARH